jgi:hypothetical protein
MDRAIVFPVISGGIHLSETLEQRYVGCGLAIRPAHFRSNQAASPSLYPATRSFPGGRQVCAIHFTEAPIP